MDWNGYLDLYCERLIPGFWGEPLNAVSNAAFYRQSRSHWDIHTLLIMLALGLAGRACVCFA